MSNKTIFNAIDTELRNARVALNAATRYMDVIKDVVDTIVISKNGDGFLRIGLDSEDESIVYGFKVKGVNRDLKAVLKII